MRYRLADHGLVFSTRDRGARILADLRKQTGDGCALSSVEIDFTGIRSLSYSFVDECIGELMQQAEDATPTLVNVPPSVARTIERSLRRRGIDADAVLTESLETT